MTKGGAIFLISTGIAAIGAAIFAATKSSSHVDAIKDAIAMPPAAPGTPTPTPSTTPRAGSTFVAHLTGYWPFTATASEQKMEGAPVDRKGQPLHTVEDFLTGKSDHVSLSGDYDIFPYGQKVMIPWGGRMLTGRVTDTGGHFHGINKVYRVVGEEPIDVCVQSSSTVIPQKSVTAQIVSGDNLAGGAAVATNKILNQVVAGIHSGAFDDILSGDYETDTLNLANIVTQHEVPKNYEDETISLNQPSTHGLPTDYETNMVDLMGDFYE